MKIACPRCTPPGDPQCPYCDGTYEVAAPPGYQAGYAAALARLAPVVEAARAVRESWYADDGLNASRISDLDSALAKHDKSWKEDE